MTPGSRSPNPSIHQVSTNAIRPTPPMEASDIRRNLEVLGRHLLSIWGGPLATAAISLPLPAQQGREARALLCAATEHACLTVLLTIGWKRKASAWNARFPQFRRTGHQRAVSASGRESTKAAAISQPPPGSSGAWSSWSFVRKQIPQWSGECAGSSFGARAVRHAGSHRSSSHRTSAVRRCFPEGTTGLDG